MASRSLSLEFGLLLLAGVLLLGSVPAATGASTSAPAVATFPASPQAAAFSQLGLNYYPGAELGYSPTALKALTIPRAVDPNEPLSLGITLLPRDEEGLARVASTVPSTKQFLTGAELEEEYGPTASAYSDVEASFVEHGFTIVQSYSDRDFLQVHGTMGAAEHMFSTTLVSGTYEGRSALLPATIPSLPPSIAPYVFAVSGLSQGISHFSVDSATTAVSDTSILPNYPHFMYDLDGLYNLSGGPHWSSSETIGLLLWGDGYNPSDLTSFASTLYPSDEPSFTITPVPLDGAPAPSASAVLDPSGAPFELTLDMEWSESQAPGANLVPVYVPDGPGGNNKYSPSDADLENGLAYLLQMANSSSVNVISMSWGTQDGQDPSFQASFDSMLQMMGTEGVSVFASSGDDGGSLDGTPNACTTVHSTQFPASSPYVTAVGGTAPVVSVSLTGSSSPTLQSEPAWDGSDGGYSVDYTAPSWQLSGSAGDAIQSQGGGMRGVPDVAGPAASNVLYYNSTTAGGSGTSFASPMWAGLAAEMDALHGADLGFLAPQLYQLGLLNDAGTSPVPFNNITSGSNCFYTADGQWNPVTGYGSPHDAVVLYGELVHELVRMSVTTNPTTAAPGSTVGFTVQLGSVQGSSVADLPVTVSVYSQSLTAAESSLLSQQVLTTGSTGSASGSFIVPITYIHQKILVTVSTFTPHSIGTASTTVGISPLGAWWGPLSILLVAPVSYGFFALCIGLATVLGWYLGRKVVSPSRAPSSTGRPVRRAASRVRPPTSSPPSSVAPPPRPPRPAGAAPPSAPAAASGGASAEATAPSPPPTPPTAAPPPVPPAEDETPWTGIATYSAPKKPAAAPPSPPEPEVPATAEAAAPTPEPEPPPEEPAPEVPAPPPEEPTPEPHPEVTAEPPEDLPAEVPTAPEPEARAPEPEAPVSAETPEAPSADTQVAEDRERRTQQKKVVSRRKQQEAPPAAPPPPAKVKPKRKTSKT